MDSELLNELRSQGTLNLEGKRIFGIAIPYNSVTDVGNGISEVIRPGAMTDLLRSNPKIVAIQEHMGQYVLGSTTSGTLKLTDTPAGLAYEITPPEGVSYIQDLMRSMEANPGTFGSSFHMQLIRGGFTVTRTPSGGYLRDIKTISQCREITITAFPCYTDSSAMLRSILANEKPQDDGRPSAVVTYCEIRKRSL